MNTAHGQPNYWLLRNSVLGAIVLLIWVSCTQVPSTTAIQRRQDIKNLLQASREMREAGVTNPPSFSELNAFLSQRGIKLINPMPRDPLAPCYRVIPKLDESSWVVEIEEVNVTDDEIHFVGLADGSIMGVKPRAGSP
jgi:hypothetical protein